MCIYSNTTVKSLLKLSFLCLFLFFPNLSFSRTASEVITQARILSRDTGTTRQRYTDAQYLEWVNQGQREFVAQTWVVKKSTTFALIAGVTYYAMPSDFISTDRVLRGFLEIAEVTPAAMDSKSQTWETIAGLPIYYFVNFSSRTQIGFTPFPNSTVTDTDTIKVDYFSQLSSMTATGSAIFENIKDFEPYIDALSYYAASRAALLDGRGDMAQFYVAQYQMMLSLMKEKGLYRPNYRPGLIGRRE